MIVNLVRRLPAPLRVPLRAVGIHTGKHRGPRAHGALVDTEFVTCEPCGDVMTAAIRHGDIVRCTEGHDQPAGGTA